VPISANIGLEGLEKSIRDKDGDVFKILHNAA
jgi:hypothetical protein